MEITLSALVRGAIAVAGAILLTIAVGIFQATPVNPEQAREIQQKLDVAVEKGLIFGKGEADRYFAVSDRPDPPTLVSILDWHAWLLVPFSVFAVLLLRVPLAASFSVSTIAALILYHFIGLRTAAFLFLPVVLTSAVITLILKRRVATSRGAA